MLPPHIHPPESKLSFDSLPTCSTVIGICGPEFGVVQQRPGSIRGPMCVGPPMLQDNLQNFATCFKADGALRYSVFGGGAHRIINRRHSNCLRSGVRHVRNVEAKGHVADGTQHGNSLTQRPQICAAEPGPNYCPSVQMSKLVLYASPIELVSTVKFLWPKRDVTTLWLFHRG